MNTGIGRPGGSDTDVELVRTTALMAANSALSRDPSNGGGCGYSRRKPAEEYGRHSAENRVHSAERGPRRSGACGSNRAGALLTESRTTRPARVRLRPGADLAECGAPADASGTDQLRMQS
jgi:hypothetical protein